MKRFTLFLVAILFSTIASSQIKSEQSIAAVFHTLTSGGALQDADSLPTGTLYVNGVADAATVTVTNITTGKYKASVTCPVLTAGYPVQLEISATIDTVATAATIVDGFADTKRVSDLNDIAAGAEMDLVNAPNGTAITAIQNGLATPTNITSASGVSLASTQTFDLTGDITGSLSGSVGSVSSPVTAGTVSDKTGYSLTTQDWTVVSDLSLLALEGSLTNGTITLSSDYDLAKTAATQTSVDGIASLLVTLAGGTWSDETLVAIMDAVEAISSITPQEVRDAMKLAASVGSPSDGSIDDKLGDIQTSADAASRPGDEMDLVNAPNGTAVTAIQNGLATPTNITSASGIQLASSQHVIVDSGTVTSVTNAVTGDWTTDSDLSGIATALNVSSTQTAILAAVGTPLQDGDEITAQEVRDAMKLAPSAGAAASDSIDDMVADIEAGTGLTAQETRDAMMLAPSAGTPASGSIDKHLDDLVVVSGTGDDTCTLTMRTSASVPIPSMKVWITNDALGAVGVAGPSLTNDSGQVKFKLTDGNTYYLWAQKTGYPSTQGQTFVAAED